MAFRSHHDHSTLSDPYNQLIIQSDVIKNIDFQIYPVSFSGSKPLWLLQGHTYLIYDNWKAYIQPVVTKDGWGQNTLGADFARFGLNGRIINSFLRYENDNVFVQIGRAPVRWGQSWDHSIVQSGLTPQYDHVYLRAKLGSFNWDLLSGSLNTEMIGNKRIRRHIAGHKLSGLFFNNRLLLEAGEQIIYTGENRNMELFYLNPAVPYVFAAYEGEDLSVDGNNNDNGMIFVDFRWIHKPYLSFYGEFILDDFQIDDTKTQDMLGFKLGADGAFQFRTLPFTWEAEYTQLDSWTYIHRGQYSTWENRGHAIGNPYGTDLRSFRIQTDAWLRADNLLLNLEYTWLEKGANTLQTDWGNTISLKDPFPSRPVNIMHMAEISLSYWMKYGIIEVGWSNIPFANEIAYGGRTELKGGIYFKLQLLVQFGFDVE